MTNCGRCDGSGLIPVPWDESVSTCPDCDGSGDLDDELSCEHCHDKVRGTLCHHPEGRGLCRHQGRPSECPLMGAGLGGQKDPLSPPEPRAGGPSGPPPTLNIPAVRCEACGKQFICPSSVMLHMVTDRHYNFEPIKED